MTENSCTYVFGLTLLELTDSEQFMIYTAAHHEGALFYVNHHSNFTW